MAQSSIDADSAAETYGDDAPIEGISSLLDTDLYKLTMQCAILKFFPHVPVEYAFTNRTSHMRLNRQAYAWLQQQIKKLGDLHLTHPELEFLQTQCKFLHAEYLEFLKTFRLRPSEQVITDFVPSDGDFGDLHIRIHGSWLDTILYEVPILALISEAYFKFVDQDWTHEQQKENAHEKGLRLVDAGCMFSDFGTRRRRDLRTHDLVVSGLKTASDDTKGPGKLTGTSNVYLAWKHMLTPVGTVGHEWYMAIASITDDYENANELGLSYWLKTYGEGVLGVALTDTFGTPAFFKAFKKEPPRPSDTTIKTNADVSSDAKSKTYADVFTGIRQDSGDPREYTKMAAEFYKALGVTGKSIVYSDALNTDLCIEYKAVAEQYGFKPSFGVGTYFTNDFHKKTNPHEKSKPLNVVIKISKAGGRPSIKISDNVGKNTGDAATVAMVKERLGYDEKFWEAGDEAKRW